MIKMKNPNNVEIANSTKDELHGKKTIQHYLKMVKLKMLFINGS